MGTSPGRSSMIFRGRPGDVGGRPGEQYLPAGCSGNFSLIKENIFISGVKIENTQSKYTSGVKVSYMC